MGQTTAKNSTKSTVGIICSTTKLTAVLVTCGNLEMTSQLVIHKRSHFLEKIILKFLLPFRGKVWANIWRKFTRARYFIHKKAIEQEYVTTSRKYLYEELPDSKTTLQFIGSNQSNKTNILLFKIKGSCAFASQFKVTDRYSTYNSYIISI